MSAIHSTTLFAISGATVDQTVLVENGTTWIIREFCCYSGDGEAQIDISQHYIGNLIYRHVFTTVVAANAPDTQLRHLVLSTGGDDPDVGIDLKYYGAHWDVQISGYILNGIYLP
jgi:hypothetical protein